MITASARGDVMSFRFLLLSCIAAAFLWGAQAAAETVRVELNKLEDREQGSCLAYLVFENERDQTFDTFRLDLVMFDQDGIIARRLALAAGPLHAGKTVVKMFEVGDLACDAIGRILLNEVSECEVANGDTPDCTAVTRATQRTEVPFDM